jgi:hypothetical protein
MPTLQTFPIFKAGTHTAMGGITRTFGPADIRGIAATYSPSRHSAPLVLGHPKNDYPTYGAVLGLSTDKTGATLYAHAEVSDTLTDLVRAGAYRTVSAKLYDSTAAKNPEPGALYLGHVGFLGACPPAVRLGPLNFAQPGQGAEAWLFGFADLGVYSYAWGQSNSATDAPHHSCFAAPAGAHVNPERLALHLKIKQHQSKNHGMSYAQALHEYAATIRNH